MDEKKRKEKKNPGGVFMPVFSYCFESFPKTCPPINAKISFGMKDHFTMSPKMKTKEKKSSLGGWGGLQHATFKGAFTHIRC
jgi:hypothetical protein